MKSINECIKSTTCQWTTFGIGAVFFIIMFCINNPVLIIPSFMFFTVSLCGVLLERCEYIKKEFEEQNESNEPKKEPTEWMGYKNGDKHVLTIFFDEKNEKYRIAEMYSLKVLPHQFDTKVDSLNYIYSNYENVVGMVVYNCY